MTRQLQQLIYEGWLVADPEMHYTPKGGAVTNFRMGSNSDYNDSEGELVKETTWLKVSCWGKTAEAVNQYCGKGSRVIVMGKLRPGKNGSPVVYQLKDSGDYAASYEVTAKEVHILKFKEGVTPKADTAADEELPF